MQIQVTREQVIARAKERFARPGYLASIKLRHGTGSGEPGDSCLIQAERWELREAARELGAMDFVFEYDPSTDACPPCTSPLCRSFAISVQDAREEWRAECVALLPLLPGSAGSEALEQRRGWRMFDWSVRESLPAGVDLLAATLRPHDAALADRLGAQAKVLRELKPIVDQAAAKAIIEPLRALDLDLARALARALDLDLALDLALALARDLALALARDLDLDLSLALDLAHALALSLALPSPVALLKELLEMRES
jgi:hypothetical protein